MRSERVIAVFIRGLPERTTAMEPALAQGAWFRLSASPISFEVAGSSDAFPDISHAAATVEDAKRAGGGVEAITFHVLALRQLSQRAILEGTDVA